MALVLHLVILGRLPRLGAGKRRLAAEIGDVAALSVQRTMLDKLIRTFGRNRPWRTYLAITPNSRGLRLRGQSLLIQSRGDLGDRMSKIARSLPPGPVVLIGSDAPDVRPEHISRAFRELGDKDAVFGPATDGGYWLVGLKRRPKYYDPFQRVRWSTEHALRDTLGNLDRHRVSLLATLADIDDLAALQRFRAREAKSWLL